MKHLPGLLLVAAMVGCGDSAVTAPAIENNQGNSRGAVADTSQESTTDDSVAALEELGAQIKRNKKGEVVGVAFIGLSGMQIADAELVHLKGLTSLEDLHLRGTQITDAGLVHLRGLTNLQVLWLGRTQITDAGLVHLEGLANVWALGLSRTQITDAGLVHLKGLTNLKALSLGDTQVSNAGVAELKEALPGCGMTH